MSPPLSRRCTGSMAAPSSPTPHASRVGANQKWSDFCDTVVVRHGRNGTCSRNCKSWGLPASGKRARAAERSESHEGSATARQSTGGGASSSAQPAPRGNIRAFQSETAADGVQLDLVPQDVSLSSRNVTLTVPRKCHPRVAGSERFGVAPRVGATRPRDAAAAPRGARPAASAVTTHFGGLGP